MQVGLTFHKKKVQRLFFRWKIILDYASSGHKAEEKKKIVKIGRNINIY